MKLFENLDDSDSLEDALKKIIADFFHEEVDDEIVDGIANNLSLSDILALDAAYTKGDKKGVEDILGPIPRLEYTVKQGRQATSTAKNAKSQMPQSTPQQNTPQNTTQAPSDQEDNGPPGQKYSNSQPDPEDEMMQLDEMKSILTKGGFPTFINRAEHHFIEEMGETVYKKDLTERQAEIARMLTSRGVLQRFKDQEGIYYAPNTNKRILDDPNNQ